VKGLNGNELYPLLLLLKGMFSRMGKKVKKEM
jgi:hypothetical protein